jgi:hypothetical protein
VKTRRQLDAQGRELGPRRLREDEGGTGKAGREADVIEEIAAEFSTEELLEFLEADQLPIEADPEFRERLRSELWHLVQGLVAKPR